ncbi:MAG TPA: hypothetical protein VHV76_12630 [Mycobacteriales bacterium]|jgi:hypothetical protein|nr:hypothetical protein [Mycobacteriales bacterium]
MPSRRGPFSRAALAASVTLDLDLNLAPGGVVLLGKPAIKVTWPECRRAFAGAEPESETGRSRLAYWLQVRRWLADHPIADLAARTRPYGVTVDSPIHPGPAWVRRRVLGGALDLGIGFAGLDPDHPEAIHTLSPEALRIAGVDPTPWWPAASVYLERMGEAAADRLRRDPTALLHPIGDCDVVTLLGSRTLRAAIATSLNDGMRSIAVPTRSRGWMELRRIDPAFAAAAARMTRSEDRGFARPLLVTRDEVLLGRDGSGVVRAALDDRFVPCRQVPEMAYYSV